MISWIKGARFALAGLLVLGCSPGPTPAPAAPATATEPALWRIADADSEIWLFGTVHVLPPELRWRGPRFEAAFAAAEELVTESDVDPAVAGALMTRYGALPEGARLGDLLSAAERAQLARVAQRLRADPRRLETLRPWLAAVQLSYTYAAQNGHSSDAGVENVLLPEARAAGKRISFLETPEQQVRMLADLPPADQLRFLAETMRQIEEESQALDEIDALWLRGDVEALGRELDTQLKGAGPAVFDALIVQRNRAWSDEIERRLAGSGRIFYAVGAAHLAGEASVITLLRDRGVTVEGP